MIIGIIASSAAEVGPPPSDIFPQIDISFAEIIEIVDAEDIPQVSMDFHEITHI